MSTGTAHDNLKAYKLYLKAFAEEEYLVNPKFWGDKEPFTLTWTKLKKLFINATESGFKFPRSTIKPTDSQARVVANAFKDLGINTAQDTLDDFASLFGRKSYSDFFEDKPLLTEYLEKLRVFQLKKENENCHQFILFYWNKSMVCKASLVIETDKNYKVTDVFLKFYEPEVGGAGRWRERKEKNLLKKEIKVENTPGNCHIYISQPVPSFFTLHSSDDIYNNKKFLFCNFTSTFAGIPISGIGVLKKVEDIEREINKPFEPLISNMLFQRSHQLSEKEYTSTMGTADEFSFDANFRGVGEKFTGIYEGYYLDKDFEDGQKVLRTLLLEILPSGKVKIQDGEGGSGDMTGFCFITADKQIMYITADHKYEVGGLSRYQIIIDIPQARKGQLVLKGVYGGYSKNAKPYIGLIQLRYLAKRSDREAGSLMEKFSPTDFKGEEQRAAYKTKRIPEEVFSFFKEEVFYHSPEECLDPQLLRLLLSTGKSAYRGPTGVFYIYSSSGMKKGIVRYPLLIRKNGDVVLHSKDKILEPGKASLYFSSKFLLLNFHLNDSLAANDRPDKGQFLFCNSHRSNVPFIPGTSIRISQGDKAQAKREFLVKLCDETTDAKNQAVFDRLSFNTLMPDDPRFKELPRKLATTLLGREYNLIVVSSAVDKDHRVLRRENFSRLYFNTALFEYFKAGSKKDNTLKNNITRYIKLAIEHGLLDKAEFDSMINVHSRTFKTDMSKAFPFFQEIFERELVEYFKIGVS